MTPIYLPNGDILNANDLMIDHDFDNDPVFKAKKEKAIEFFRKHPIPDHMFPGRKKSKIK